MDNEKDAVDMELDAAAPAGADPGILGDNSFDAAAFARIVAKGVGDGRAAAAARSSSRAAGPAAAATAALLAFASAASSANAPNAPDVVAAYLDLNPAAAELFAPLWLGAVRPAATAAALDCLLAVAHYAHPPAGKAYTGPAIRPVASVTKAKSVLKDVVKGRAAAIYDSLSRNGSAAAFKIADKTLLLLAHVAASHPLLAKETVNRFDLASRTLAPSLCNKTARMTRRSFCNLVVALLTSGDHDVVWALSTRSRQAVVSCLKAYAPTPAVMSVGDAEAVQALLAALEERVLTCPNHSIPRSAFEAPVLDTIALIASQSESADEDADDIDRSLSASDVAMSCRRSAVQKAAKNLFRAVVMRQGIVTTAQVAHILGDMPVTESQTALSFVLDSVAHCPRAARMLLQIGPFVSSTPRLSTAWLACAAVIARCVRELRTPSHVFARTKFFEKCWTHDSSLVRHHGLLIAAAFCEVIAAHPHPDRVARVYLPTLPQAEAVLRVCDGEDSIAHRVYASYRSLFSKEFDETKADAIRIAMESGYGNCPSVLESLIRACLARSPAESLATLFHRHLFSALLKEEARKKRTGNVVTSPLLSYILLATGLFPTGTEHEADLWLLAVVETAQLDNAWTEFETFVATAWANPFALFDDVALLLPCNDSATAISMSLLSAAALRRLRKIASTGSVLQDGSFGHVLCISLALIKLGVGSNEAAALVDHALQSTKVVLPVALPEHLLANSLVQSLHQLSRYSESDGDRASSDTVAGVWRLTDYIRQDCTLAGPVQRYLLMNGKESSATSSNSVLLGLLLRIANVAPETAGRMLLSNQVKEQPLLLTLPRTFPNDDSSVDGQRLLVAAFLLRMSIPQTLRHSILRSLCSGPLSGKRRHALSSNTDYICNNVFGVREVVLRSVTDLLQKGIPASGLENTMELDADHVRQLVWCLAAPSSSRDMVGVLNAVAALIAHDHPSVRAGAYMALNSIHVEWDYASLPGSASATLVNLVENVYAVQRSFIAFLADMSASSLSSESLVAILPAISAILEQAAAIEPCEDVIHDALPSVAATLVPALFACDRRHAIHEENAPESIVDHVARVSQTLVPLCPDGGDLVSSYLDWHIKRTDRMSSLDVCVQQAMFRIAGSPVLAHNRTRLVSLFLKLSLSDSGDTLSRLVCVKLMLEGLQACHTKGLLRGMDMRRIESVEANMSTFIVAAVKHANDDPTYLRAVHLALTLDMVLDHAASAALVILADLDDNACQDDVIWAAALGNTVCSAVNRLPRLQMDKTVATSLIELEGLFSRPGLYRGSSSLEDRSMHLAMCSIATALQSAKARLLYLLPERRDSLFHYSSADLVGLLDSSRLAKTADRLTTRHHEDVSAQSVPLIDAYDAIFTLTILRRAACEASDRPTAAVLDLDAVARSGLLGVAVASLAAADERVRVAAFAALGALTKAVGPESGVTRDAAAALFRDRRQLAFVINLLRSSVRTPLEPVTPLFATFFRFVAPIVLRPTHSAYQEVTRYLLRSPVHNLHDADGVAYLLRDANRSCRDLAVEILQHGICSGADHHIARRRRMYDSIFALGIDHAAGVLTALMAVIGRCQGQIAADLVRSHGILPWLMSSGQSSSLPNDDRLRLLAKLALMLPRGVLQSRYAPSFARTLEDLAADPSTCSSNVVADTALAIARLDPTRRRLFCLCAVYRRQHLVVAVYSKNRGPELSAVLLQRAVMACCQVRPSDDKDSKFPNSPVEMLAAQAFVAECLIENADLRTEDVKSALACLMLDAEKRINIWGVVAALTVVSQGQWTPELWELADTVPGRVADVVVENRSEKCTLSMKLRLMLASLLTSVSKGGAQTDGDDENDAEFANCAKKKRRKET
jgi:Nucleolar pre-ribosomal-associated protein 1